MRLRDTSPRAAALPRLTLLAAFAGAAFAGAACGPAAPGPWHEAEGFRWRELAPRQGDGNGFTRLSADHTGITFSNRLSPREREENENLANGSGVAVGDVDADGRPDLFLAGTGGESALYLNRGGLRFEEAAGSAGIELEGKPTTGAALADVDGDGDLDLAVGVLGEVNRLYLNDGAGRFRDATAGSGFEGAWGTTTLALADVDGDGDLDLYAANYKKKLGKDLYPEDELNFENVFRETEDGEYEVAPRFREHYRVWNTDRFVTTWEVPEPDEFYLNEGGGRFRRVGWSSGRFRDAGGGALSEAPREWALAARFYDWTGDGAPDLYVANDFQSPDAAWVNDGSGSFRAAGPEALRTTSMSSMAVDFADADRDGDVDLFVADMLSSTRAGRVQRVSDMRPEQVPPGDAGLRVQRNRNTLQLARGDGTFAEAAAWSGVAASGWTWGVAFVDVDLDGWEDLLVTTGHAWDVLSADARQRAMPGAAIVTDRETLPRLSLSNVAYRGLGDGRFAEVSAEWGWGEEPDVSHGLALGDLDGDGDRDVVVSRLDAPAAVYRNDAAAERVAVRLAGRGQNTRGVGSVVVVRAPGLPPQRREVTAGGLYVSGSDYGLSFAAGAADSVEIEVRWRSGWRSVVRGARPGRLYEIREP